MKKQFTVKSFSGFTRWYNKTVKPEYKITRKLAIECFLPEYFNTGSIEVPRHITKDGQIRCFPL